MKNLEQKFISRTQQPQPFVHKWGTREDGKEGFAVKSS